MISWRVRMSISLCGAWLSSSCTELAEAFTPDDAGARAHNSAPSKPITARNGVTPVAENAGGSAPTSVRSAPAGGDFRHPRPRLVRNCQDTDEKTNPCSIPRRQYALNYVPDSGTCGELSVESYVHLDDAAKSVESCIDYEKGITEDGSLYLARECRYAQLSPPARVLSQAFIKLVNGGGIEGWVFVELREGPDAPCADGFSLFGVAQ